MSDSQTAGFARVREGRPPAALLAADRLSASSWIVGATLSALLLAIELLATFAAPSGERIAFSWFRVLSLPLLSGYVVVATCGIATASARNVDALAPVLELGDRERDDFARAVVLLPLRAHALCAAVGLGVPVAVGIGLSDLRSVALAGHPEALAFWAMATLFWWLVAQAIALLLRLGRGFRGLGRDAVRVDLFRAGALAPFGRFAVQSALFVCGGLALAVLLASTPGAEASWLPRLQIARGVGALAALFAASAACALLALVLPLLGIRERIREEKERMVHRLEMELPHKDAEQAALLEGIQRAAGLLAIRDRVQAVAEWPVDPAMRRRFGLYALLPVTSWVAKVVLEVGVDWILR